MKFALVVLLLVEFSSGDRLTLKLIKHLPCTISATPYERIRFPSIGDAPLIKDPSRGKGCYVIHGPVSVTKSIRGTVQIYNEVKFGATSPPESCENADSAGCGGIGSCVYCNPCKGIDNIDQTSSGLVKIESTSGENPLDCQNGIKPGNYTHIRISFCLPTKEDVMKAEKIDESTFNEYVANERMFFSTLYIFKTTVNTLPTEKLRAMADPNSKSVIGCHKIVGTVRDNGED